MSVLNGKQCTKQSTNHIPPTERVYQTEPPNTHTHTHTHTRIYKINEPHLSEKRQAWMLRRVIHRAGRGDGNMRTNISRTKAVTWLVLGLSHMHIFSVCMIVTLGSHMAGHTHLKFALFH